MKRLIAVILILMLVGCVSSREKRAKRMETQMNSWKGKTITQLISSHWGYPDEKTISPTGNPLYKYIDNYNFSGTKQVYNWSTKQYEPKLYSHSSQCITFFETNKNNVIINVRWKGNCRKKWSKKYLKSYVILNLFILNNSSWFALVYEKLSTTPLLK